ncbi:hypothetical protein BDD43_5164 [Mucilaginibacter gracilis]|uniref:Uncharacterized protein n=1 Tax=Mucilaginibacter gracilis TaxID=423350 RepID=A0A495J836_9SPHI|nr:hypothetical protein [Mucilaginibacter gracilis]RKR84911.1 hypothetical protein BDD43_5164 [Mucilaginibacter gracilis]
MEPLLITKQDFAAYRNLTVNMDDSKRLEPFILEAQRLDLCRMLGKRLYFDMIKYLTSYAAGIAAQTDMAPYQPTADELWFQKLLNGTTYNYTWPDQSTTTKIYAGLKPVLVYLSFARFVRSDNVRSTQSGFVKKTVDFSVQISDKEIQAVASRAEADANAFFTATEDFMADNVTYFRKYLATPGCLPGQFFDTEKRAGTRLTAVKGQNYINQPKRYLRR